MWGNPFLCFTKCRAKPNQINQSLSNPLTLEKSIPIFVFEKIAFKVEARASKSMKIAKKKPSFGPRCQHFRAPAPSNPVRVGRSAGHALAESKHNRGLSPAESKHNRGSSPANSSTSGYSSPSAGLQSKVRVMEKASVTRPCHKIKFS